MRTTPKYLRDPQTPPPSTPQQICNQLLGELKKEESGSRHTAILKLGNLLTSKAFSFSKDLKGKFVNAVLNCFDDQNLKVRLAAIYQSSVIFELGVLHKKIVDRLLDKSGDGNPEVRATVAEVLGLILCCINLTNPDEIIKNKIVKKLIDLTKDEDPKVRERAVQGFGNISNINPDLAKKALIVLLKAFCDEAPEVRKEAMAQLDVVNTLGGESRGYITTEELTKYVKNIPDKSYRNQVAKTLDVYP